MGTDIYSKRVGDTRVKILEEGATDLIKTVTLK